MGSWRYKIFNLFRQIIPQGSLQGEKHIPYSGPPGQYAAYDNFPLRWHKIISESPSATSCVSTIRNFLEGAGLSDETLETKIVNSRGQNFFQLHQDTVRDLSEYEGFYWHLMYDAVGRVTEWRVLPFENCRLGKPDDNGWISTVHYNPYFGTSDYSGATKKETIIYNVFNPKPEVIRKQYELEGNAYRGQVFFYGTTTATSRFYPLPEAFASVKWMGIETGVSDYHEDNINNAFLQPFMLLMKGDPNGPSGRKNSKGDDITNSEAFESMISDNFMGAKRVGTMFVQWVDQGFEAPEVLAMPSNNSGDYFITLDNQSTKKITIAFKVPPILANIHEGVSLGGDGNALRVAVKLMQHRVLNQQNTLTEKYQEVLKLMQTPYVEPVHISPYNPYPELEVLDDKIWNAMTSEEQRQWIEDNTDIILQDEQPVLPAPNPQIPARSLNAVPVGFPDKVISTVKKAVEFSDKMGLRCITNSSRLVSDDIMNNRSIGLKQIKRIYKYLNARPQYANSSFSDGCEVVKYNAWGGKPMEDFLAVKIKEFDAWLN